MGTEEEKPMGVATFWDIVKIWGPSGAALATLVWIVVSELPAQRKQFFDNIQSAHVGMASDRKGIEELRRTEMKEQREYDKSMREREWKHDLDQTARIVQAIDLQSKMAQEMLGELKRLREFLDRKSKE